MQLLKLQSKLYMAQNKQIIPTIVDETKSQYTIIYADIESIILDNKHYLMQLDGQNKINIIKLLLMVKTKLKIITLLYNSFNHLILMKKQLFIFIICLILTGF